MSDALAQLDTLRLDPQSIVIVRSGTEASDGGGQMDLGRRVSAALRARGMRNLVIVLAEGATVEGLDAAMMARHGWFRRAQKRKGGVE